MTGWAISATSSASGADSAALRRLLSGREIYSYNEQMGISMMGGIFSWLFIIQAVLIGVLFLSANYYLWLGMERIPGAERYRGWIKFLLLILTICFGVWMTPHLVASLEEARKMGGAHHPLLGVLGVMSAKNTVNLMILTFLSFMLYKRGNKVPTVPWARTGNAVEALIFALAAAIVIFYGIYGYSCRHCAHRLLGLSGGRGAVHAHRRHGHRYFPAEERSDPRGDSVGQDPERAQYALFLLRCRLPG